MCSMSHKLDIFAPFRRHFPHLWHNLTTGNRDKRAMTHRDSCEDV